MTSENYALSESGNVTYEYERGYPYVISELRPRCNNHRQQSCSAGPSRLNDTNFPDANFRNYIVNNFDNAPKDGVLSDSELRAITEITIPKSVTDATGVKHLKYLQRLNCRDCNLTALDVSRLHGAERTGLL